ncbi:MAG: hypothetical protein ACOH2D_11575 [Gelidibacter sp.]
MSNVTKQGQSFLDKVTQYTGSIDNALEMAVLNNLSITDPLVIGDIVKATAVTNKIVHGFFNPFNEPATALTYEAIAEIDNAGIGEMIIESTFIVE